MPAESLAPWVAIVSAVVALVVFAVVIWAVVRILHKAGRSGWWVLILFVPLLNLVMIWLFAFTDWPRVDRPPAAGAGESPRRRATEADEILAELESLRDRRVISRDDFERRRKAILDSL